MSAQNQLQSGIETAKIAAKEQESNLSPTAQLVNRMVTNYIMPVLRADGLVAKANEIIKSKLPADNAQVIEFSLACRQKQSEIYEKAQKEGRNEKELAVVSNYFAKMINSVQNSASTTPNASNTTQAPEAPTAMV